MLLVRTCPYLSVLIMLHNKGGKTFESLGDWQILNTVYLCCSISFTFSRNIYIFILLEN